MLNTKEFIIGNLSIIYLVLKLKKMSLIGNICLEKCLKRY